MALLLLRSPSYIQDWILKQGVGCSAECFVAAVDLHAAVADSRCLNNSRLYARRQKSIQIFNPPEGSGPGRKFGGVKEEKGQDGNFQYLGWKNF